MANQNLDWWKNMVEDFKEQEKKEESTNSDDWWKELKGELQSLDVDKKSSSSSSSPTKEAEETKA